jgi:mono/diheme cytochrome c family protein
MSSRSLGFVVCGIGLLAAIWLLPTGSAPAQALASPPSRSDIRAGRILAEHYCVQCHSIGRAGKSRHAGAPPFRDLSDRLAIESLAPRFGERISTTHPDMPRWQLDAEQDRQMIAFLKSVQRQSRSR